ncbi:nucleoid-associated protein, partial [Ligilactobacillus agilis]|uniref:nucleoid-associated protein n=1 Tax=Ligilactobacillus agilis TaxID=1601 RepID=UPI000A66D2C5
IKRIENFYALFCFQVSVKDQTCFIHNKVYQGIQGKWSFLERILEVTEKKPKISEEVAQVKKALKTVSKKYDIEQYEAVMGAQKALYDSIDEEASLSSERVAEQVFGDNHQAKQEFLEELDQKGIQREIALEANTPVFERKYQKQKLKLDNGIEIVVPAELLKNKDYIEFVTNDDGSLSVILKKIESIKNNF